MKKIFTTLCMVALGIGLPTFHAEAQSGKFKALLEKQEYQAGPTRSAASNHRKANSQVSQNFGDAPELLSLDHFGADGASYITGSVTDASGNVYAVGDFSGELSIQENSISTDNFKAVFLAKFDSEGALVWIKEIFGSESGIISEAYSNDIEISSTGEVFVSGYFRGGNYIVGGIDVSSENNRGFLLKTDANGTVSWAKDFNYRNRRNLNNPIAWDGSNLYFASGYELFKLDANGATVSMKSFDSLFSLVGIAAYGQNVYLAASLSAPLDAIVDFDGVSLQSNNYYDETVVAAFDENLSLQWVKKAEHTDEFGGIGDSYPHEILANQNGVFVAGDYRNLIEFEGVPAISAGYGNSYVAKLDLQGNASWLKDAGQEMIENVSGNTNSLYLQYDQSLQELNQMNGEVTAVIEAEENEGFSALYATDDLFVQGSFHAIGEGTIRKAASFGATNDWEDQFSGDYGWTNINGMEVDDQKNVYLLGRYGGNVTVYGHEFSGTNGAFVMKKNLEGDVVWVKELENAILSNPKGSQIDVNSQGNVYIIGRYINELKVGDQTLAAEASNHIFAVSLSTEGEVNYLVKVKEGFDSHGVAADPNGNAFVSADFTSISNNPMIPVYKLDADGNEQWVVYIESQYLAYPAATDDGQLVVASERASNRISFISASGEEKVYQLSSWQDMTGLAKFDQNGELVWHHITAADTASANYTGGWPNAVEVDHEGNILMTTWYTEDSKFGDIYPPNPSEYYTEMNSGYSQGVVKFDADGNALWVKPILQVSYSFNYNEIGLDDAGNVYVGSSRVNDDILFVTSSTDATEVTGYEYNSQNIYDGYVAKVTADGEWDWIKTFTSPGYTWLTGFAVVEENEMLFSGYTRGSGITIDDQQVTSTLNHGFVAHLYHCQPGEVNFSEINATVCSEEALELGVNEVRYATAYNWSIEPATAGTITGDGTDINVTWDEAFEGTATIQVTVENECGEMVTKTQSVEVESCILSAENALSQSLELYPNPAAEATEVRMNLSSQSDVSIRLVDMSGRTVYETLKTAQVGAFRYEVNTSALEAGMYILQVKTNEGIATKQLLKK